MQILNYTPHDVTILCGEEKILFPSVGSARCKSSTVKVGELNGIPLTTTVMGRVEGLPEPKEGIVYIVSRLVALELSNRKDLYYAKEIVKKDGVLIGCCSLSQV